MPKMRMNRAIALAMAEELRADPTVLVLGEDVGAAEGVFKTSEGLLAEFGPERVRDTPIAEMGFLGLAVGVAAAGYRPVAEIMFAEFLGVALDQVVTEAAKLRFLSRGEYPVPLVVRTSAGPGLGFGAQHSQTLETWFASTPGLKVVVASGANSAYGLLRAAIRDDDPVVFFEPRALYGEREDVDTEAVAQIGRIRTLREGAEVSVVALGQTVPLALAAVAAAGLDAEVIDLATVVPWDVAGVLASVERTGRLVTVEANPYTGGWGTLVAAEISARAFGRLRAPVTRLTPPDVPVPYAKNLESAYLPTVEDVAEQLSELVRTDRAPSPWWKEKSYV